jgi:hypothetical protein
MSADIFAFEELAGSGRGLMAGIIMPNNVFALQSHIHLVSYEAKNITDNLPPLTGSLTVADVMKTSAQPWSRDSVGYGFLWQAPGTLWLLPAKVYRIVVTFTQIPAIGGLSFKLAWEVTTKDPFA